MLSNHGSDRGAILRRIRKESLVCGACLSTLTCCFPFQAAGTSYRVPSEYETIQGAIDMCTHGDTVLVAPGEYSGPGNFNLDFAQVDLYLISESGPDHTTINCGGLGRGLTLTGSATVRGFTIANGHAVEGGGVYIGDGSPRLSECIIQDCYANVGGGVWIRGANAAAIERCVVVRNQSGPSSPSVGGIQFGWLDGAVTLSDCLVSSNSGRTGGGIGGATAASVTVERSVVSKNVGATGGEA
jgi:hypothetical protein